MYLYQITLKVYGYYSSYYHTIRIYSVPYFLQKVVIIFCCPFPLPAFRDFFLIISIPFILARQYLVTMIKLLIEIFLHINDDR